MPVGASGNPVVQRGPLEASRSNVYNQEDDTFNCADNDNERWELDNNAASNSSEDCDSIENTGSNKTDDMDGSNAIHPFNNNIVTEGIYSFQIELMEILQRHGSDLIMHDEIIYLFRSYLTTGKLDPPNDDFCSRKQFISRVEKESETTGLKPKHIDVTLSNGSRATVSLFDIEYMILSLLTDKSLMKDENLAPG